ncbi:hypothetical protein JB92DRAFT_2902960, partial [Gautieria morchelliformis]
MHTPCSPCWSNPWSDRMISRRGSVVHSCPVTPLMLASGPPWFPFTFASLDKGFLPCEDLSDPISDPLVFFRLVDTWAVSPSTTHAFLSSLQWFQVVAFPARSHTHGNSFSIQPSQLGSKGPSSSNADLLTPARCASFRRYPPLICCFPLALVFGLRGLFRCPPTEFCSKQKSLPLRPVSSHSPLSPRDFSPPFPRLPFPQWLAPPRAFLPLLRPPTLRTRAPDDHAPRGPCALFLCAPLPCTPPPAAPSPSERPLQPCVFPPILFPQAQL